MPYDGGIRGWGHRLIEAGHLPVSIGKLHYRNVEDDNGFDEEILPLHVKDGIGWARGLLRSKEDTWDQACKFVEQIGPGESEYIYYPGYHPQLFDLQNDPMERHDLGRNPEYFQVVAECHVELSRIVDPDATNRRAFDDQAKKIDALGGVTSILAMENFDFTPMPKFS
jgi:hypothetical protein